MLLNDILDFSKIEAGELKLEEVPYDVRALVTQVARLQETVAKDKGLQLECRISDDVPPCLMGDPTRMQQVLHNLVNNAVKFTQEGSVTLAVSGRMDARGLYLLEVSVTDTGIGIPADKQVAVFGKFTQADVSTARKYGGTGLGLSITKNLVEMMGGGIDLHSKPGHTVFTVHIPSPLGEVKMLPANDTGSNTAPRINADARVLVVDDHPVNRLVMRATLRKMGFTALDEAESGAAAIALFGQKPYDLIFMDCQMPDIDGFAVTNRLRAVQDAAQPPIIVALTADATQGARERCLESGMDDYLSKPIERDHLVLLLERYLPGAGKVANQTPEQPVMITGAAKQKWFDPNRLAEFCDHDASMQKQILHFFLDNSPQDVAAIKAGFDAADHAAWDEAVHKLYGAASNIGAVTLAELCDQAQKLKAGEQDAVKTVHEAICRHYAELTAYLHKSVAA